MSRPELSAVVVNHRSALHALRCVTSLRETMEREAVRGEVVLVDCGSGEEDVRALRAAPADVRIPLQENRGYSGGLNAGLARAGGESLLLSNADVVFRPGSLRPLLSALADRFVGAAAPVLFWDEEERIRLPPGYPPGFWTDACQILGDRVPGAKHRFAAFARRALKLWRHGGVARHLAGAVLAVRRAVMDRVGRFDERFPFEYEETEWEDRVRAAGLDLRVEPESRARHLWARSAAAGDGVARRRERSLAVYRRRRYGRLGRSVLEALERGRGHAPRSAPERLEAPVVGRHPGAAVAISPNASLLPFAAASLAEDFRLPPELAEALPFGPLYLTVFRESDGWPLETRVWIKER